MDKKLHTKQYLTMAIIFAATFAIYNIVVLLFFEDKNNIFWISYGFMCGAFAVDIGITLFSLKSLDAEAVFMGIPLLSFSGFYFFAELFASFVFMLFRNSASVKLTVAIQMIMLLIYVIFVMLALLSRDAVGAVNQDLKVKVFNIKSMAADVVLLENQCMDAELKGELHKISEAIRFSDPMTNDAIADLDTMIKGKVMELKFQCNGNDKAAAMQTCFQLNSYISERNMKLKLLK